MAARRGNSSDYFKANSSKGRPLPFRSDAELEEAWKKAVERDPLHTFYDAAKSVKLSKESVNCSGLTDALMVLSVMTQDGRFAAAAQAMRDHGLTDGTVKGRIMTFAGKHRCFRPEWVAMDNVHLWAGRTVQDINGDKKRVSVNLAAKLVAVELGIPGETFRAVCDAIRKLYPDWLKEVKLAKVPGV
jgi:hypothetical protein